MKLSGVLEIASVTDPGMARAHNEDCIATDAANGIVVLADGMGGYNAGEVASGITVTMLIQDLQAGLAGCALQAEHSVAMASLIEQSVARANATVYQTAQSQPQCAGMGTTLVLALFCDDRVTVGHIGDSRLYRLRAEQFEQLTRDHSLLQEQIDGGMISKEEAALSHNKNLVTRALGVDPDVAAEIREFEVLPGDIYLLCSDGLSDMVPDEEIQLTLISMGVNLPLAAQQLVQTANDNGGRDNISVILIKVLRRFPARRGWFGRLLDWLSN